MLTKSLSLNKTDKIIYWIVTGLLSFLMLNSAILYFLMHDMVSGFYTNLGYPTYLIYPLAVAKILGVIAILTKKSETLKEWAYSGFFFDLLLGFAAHIAIQDNDYIASFVGLILVALSYYYDRKLKATKAQTK